VNSEWSRNDKLALYTLLIAIVGVVVALFIPEFRHMLGLNSEPSLAPSSSSSKNTPNPESPIPASSVAQSRQFIIPANVKWMDTGIKVQKGARLYISASGTVTWGAPGITDGTNVVDPNGTRPPYKEDSTYYDFPIPEAGIGSLVMRIGSVKYSVGLNATVYVKEAGNIEFMVNDDNITDNSGSFTVNIRL
jgi:hypothetical protein